MEGLLRSVSSAISDRFYSFFSLTSATLPDDEAEDEDEDEESDVGECDVSLVSVLALLPVLCFLAACGYSPLCCFGV